MHQELTIPFPSQNGRIDYVDIMTSESHCRLLYSLDGIKLDFLIANYAPLPYSFPPGFELRFHQDHSFEPSGRK